LVQLRPALRTLPIVGVVALAVAACLVAGPADAFAGGSAARAPAASAAPKTPRPKRGIDVSHWQRSIDWGQVADAGIDFAIAKATEGTGRVDHWYVRNAEAARSQGIRFTAYHYARPARGKKSARRQADFFLQHAQLTDRDLAPALDLERTDGLGPAALRRWTLTWLRRVEERLGVKPIVYTSPAFWASAMANTRDIAKAGYRVLWIAHYGTPQPQVPARRWNGHGWTIWQWTKCGHVSGISGCVDRDALNGISLKALTIRQLRTDRT
jgi:lysozyme